LVWGFISIKSNNMEHTKEIPIYIEYFMSRHEPSIILNDEKAYRYVYSLKEILSDRVNADSIDWGYFTEKKCHELFAQIINYLFTIRNELDLSEENLDTQSFIENPSINSRRLFIFEWIIIIINSVLSKSFKFGVEFIWTIGLDALVSILKDLKFSKILIEKDIQKNTSVIPLCVSNINWMSKVCENSLKRWQDLDIINVLLRFIDILTWKAVKISAYGAIINIANDKQLETISGIQKSIEAFNDLLLFAVGEHKENIVYRDLREFKSEEKIVKKYLVQIINHKKEPFSLTSVFLAFYRVAINDKIKLCIYFDLKIKDSLKIILNNGTPIEIKYVLKLIAQLTFNEKIKNDLLLDKEFIDLLKTLKINDEKSQEPVLKSVCKQIEWNLKEKIVEKLPETSTGHIMISYNFASRAICLEIKKKLESRGYKIWIDVEEIHGSSLDAMAKAVENSFCVLMCVTEKYRQSVNCQAEAQYAFRISKKIIPLIMQSGYETVRGWLGIIMGDKIYINFEEFEFDVCIEKIIHEIRVSESNMGKSNSVISMNDIKPQLSKVSNNKFEKWSEENVKDWFVTNNLSLKIFEAFSPMNGDLLFQIYELKNSAPEFYHQSLIRIDNDMRSIMMFSMMITKLYSN
jgi:hypothetical protein